MIDLKSQVGRLSSALRPGLVFLSALLKAFPADAVLNLTRKPEGREGLQMIVYDLRQCLETLHELTNMVYKSIGHFGVPLATVEPTILPKATNQTQLDLVSQELVHLQTWLTPEMMATMTASAEGRAVLAAISAKARNSLPQVAEIRSGLQDVAQRIDIVLTTQNPETMH